MQVQIDIKFEQLLGIVKTLPAVQLKKLKAEIEKNSPENVLHTNQQLEVLLLSGPVATEKQLKIIEHNRDYINQWRIK